MPVQSPLQGVNPPPPYADAPPESLVAHPRCSLLYDAFKRRFGKRIGESITVHPKAFSITSEGMKVPTYMFFCVMEELESL